MRYLTYTVLLGVLLFAAARSAHAQVRVGVAIGAPVVGPAPVCAYGYYGYYPYACAPYGYYGPRWFADGVFVGAGPWFHGHGFYGPRYFERRGFEGRFHGDLGRDGFRGRGFGRGSEVRGGVHGGGFHGSAGFHGGGHR